MNFDRLTDEILAASERALAEVTATPGQLPLAGLALCSDAGAMSVSPAFNTQAHLARNARDDPLDTAYYRWSPGEWDLESRGSRHFEGINLQLRRAAAAVAPGQFAAFRVRLFDACVAALSRLRQQPQFAAALRGSAIVFSVTDLDDAPREKAWIKALNPQRDAQQFCRWRDSLSQ